MHYREIKPSPQLNGSVECYWSAVEEPGQPDATHGIVPGGYADIVFNLGDRVDKSGIDTSFLHSATSWLVGPFDHFTTFFPRGRFEFFGVRFYTGKAPVFPGLPLSRVRNGSMPLASVCGQALRERLTKLEVFLHREHAVEERVEAMDAFLIDLLEQCNHTDWAVAEAIQVIEAARGRISVGEISSQLGTGERRLERMFSDSVGLSPKAFARITRFNQTRKLLHAAPHDNWSATAQLMGYYDQTHFINEFRSFTGQTPARFQMDRSVGFFLYDQLAG